VLIFAYEFILKETIEQVQSLEKENLPQERLHPKLRLIGTGVLSRWRTMRDNMKTSNTREDQIFVEKEVLEEKMKEILPTVYEALKRKKEEPKQTYEPKPKKPRVWTVHKKGKQVFAF